jgi:hypothetical protein
MMAEWHELVAISNTVSFTREEDMLIWYYETNAVYSFISMYALVKSKGVTHMFLPDVRKLKIAPIVQVFVWWARRIKLWLEIILGKGVFQNHWKEVDLFTYLLMASLKSPLRLAASWSAPALIGYCYGLMR